MLPVSDNQLLLMNSIVLRLKRHYLPLIILSLFSATILFLIWNTRDTLTFVADSTGYISLLLLAVALVIGSINLALKRNNPISTYLRRDLGIYGGLLAIIHSITGLFVHLRGNMWQYFFVKTELGYAIRLDDFGIANYTGLISAFLILLLLVTSNDYSIRKLNPVKWKNLQRLTYLMFAIALLHSVYYRLVGNDLNRIYYLYLPLLSIILIFQFIGVRLKTRNKQIISN